MLKTFIMNLGMIASQLLNVLFLRGYPGVTVSTRCYVNRKFKGWRMAYKFINAMFFLQENHCKTSFENDVHYATSVMKLKRDDHITERYW